MPEADAEVACQLRRWRRDGVPFTVIDTDEDITQILLA